MDNNNTKHARRFNSLILLGIGLVALFWVLDAIADAIVLHEGGILAQLFRPKVAELWGRLLGAGFVSIITIYAFAITRQLKQANAELVRYLANYEEALRALNESKTKYHSLVEQIPAAVYIWELGDGGACLYISPQIEQMLGFTVAEWLADPDLFFRQVHPDDRALAIAAEEHSKASGEPLHSEFRMIARDGRTVWIRDQSEVLPDEAGRPLYNQGILIDITKSKRTEEALRQQSIRDPLTGLFNRRYLKETLERELSRTARNQQPVGIIMVDIDHFKSFNDTFGHDAGDVLLIELSNFLRSHIRSEDVACRFGGEEFIIILPGASPEVTHQRAEQFRMGFKLLSLKQNDEPGGRVTLSLGVAIFPDHGSTSEELLKAADIALYNAKHKGRDRIEVAE